MKTPFKKINFVAHSLVIRTTIVCLNKINRLFNYRTESLKQKRRYLKYEDIIFNQFCNALVICFFC